MVPLDNPFVKRRLSREMPKTNILHTMFPPTMNTIKKITRLMITVLGLMIILYATGSTIVGTFSKADAAPTTIDPLEQATQERLTLLKALRAENQAKMEKEAALKETNDNIELLKQKDAEKQKAIDTAVTTPAPVAPKGQ